MKIVVETGTESHSTSSAKVQAKYHGGQHDGKQLYEVKQNQVKAVWDENNGKHSQWVLTEYELPEGTEIEVIGDGRVGARGAEKREFHRIYKLDSKAEVTEITIDTGLRESLLKGRLVEVKKVVPVGIDTEGGF